MLFKVRNRRDRRQEGDISYGTGGLYRASDRVRKKITNYAEIFRNIMRKKVLIMRKTRWIMRKIFGSLRSPKITSFHSAEIELPLKARVCSQANFKTKIILVFGLFQFFSFVFDML